ncbi:MAG: hypothetical protein V5A42_06060 [Halofilum sp. (in: g-proteobacteria)]
MLVCGVAAGAAGLSSPGTARLDAGAYIKPTTASGWSFRLLGVVPGQRYEYSISGRGHDALRGRGVVGANPHIHAVDLSPFRRGAIRIRVRLLDVDGTPKRSLTDTVLNDPAYPAGYL